METPKNWPARTLRVEMVRSGEMVMFCALCGGELGPQPVQARLVVAEPEPADIGSVCGECLSMSAALLVPAIEEHRAWLLSLVGHLDAAIRQLRADRLPRPTFREWEAANVDELNGKGR